MKTLVMGLALFGGAITVGLATSGEAQVVLPTSEPLFQQSNLAYRGAFKLPQSAGSLGNFQYGGSSLVYNGVNHSLFVQGRDNLVAEIGIPALVKSGNYNDLNAGTVMQPLTPIDDQNIRLQGNPADTFIRGLFIHRSQLVASFVSYYDGNNLQTTSHMVRPMTLSTTGQARGPFKVGNVMPGHVAGYMTPIPTEWQPLLGGPALTGNFAMAILTRLSFGPAAWVFNPDHLGVMNPVPATAVLDYPDAGHALGPWDGSSNVWNTTSTFAGMGWVRGTRSVLFIGTMGTGPFCYGNGSSVNPNNGEAWCYDPEGQGKGPHGYPYAYRVWAYDANDLLAVKQGTRMSWEPRPYAIWDLSLPMATSWHTMPGATYDPQTQTLFMVQAFGPTDPAYGFPVVHVYAIGDGPDAPRHVRLQ
jgi:hypothetical protein